MHANKSMKRQIMKYSFSRCHYFQSTGLSHSLCVGQSQHSALSSRQKEVTHTQTERGPIIGTKNQHSLLTDN